MSCSGSLSQRIRRRRKYCDVGMPTFAGCVEHHGCRGGRTTIPISPGDCALTVEPSGHEAMTEYARVELLDSPPSARFVGDRQ